MIIRYLKLWPVALIMLLAIACWHYRDSASIWHQKEAKQATRANKAEDANTTLIASNNLLNERNRTLVESINARSDELETEKRRADANRTAYQHAVSANRDWANERIPDSVSDSLRRATGRLQGGSSAENPSSH